MNETSIANQTWQPLIARQCRRVFFRIKARRRIVVHAVEHYAVRRLNVRAYRRKQVLRVRIPSRYLEKFGSWEAFAMQLAQALLRGFYILAGRDTAIPLFNEWPDRFPEFQEAAMIGYRPRVVTRADQYRGRLAWVEREWKKARILNLFWRRRMKRLSHLKIVMERQIQRWAVRDAREAARKQRLVMRKVPE